MKYNKTFCHNSVENRDGDVKIILTLDYLKKGMCVLMSDLQKSEIISGAYRIPNTGFFTDYFSYKNLSINNTHLVYIAIPTKTTVDINNAKVPVYTLQYLSPEDEELFINGELKDKKIKAQYQEPESLGAGSFGSVIYYPHQGFVAKKFTEWNSSTPAPKDMIKEIAIYRLFENDCLVKMKGFDLNKGLVFFERGIETLKSAYEILSPEKSRDILFKLAVCMRGVAIQGVINNDLKPSNMVLAKNGDIRIIDWGIASVNRSEKQRMYGRSTLWWSSPESLSDSNRNSYKSDIFSLGIIFLQVLTKKIPCMGQDDNEQIELYKILIWNDMRKLNSIMNDDQTDWRSRISNTDIMTDLPPDARDLIAGMLTPNISRRIEYNEIVHHPYFREKDVPMPKVRYLNNMPKHDYSSAWNKSGHSLKVRSTIIVWMAEMCIEFELYISTFFLGVQLFDLLMLLKPVKQKQLQLLGITAIFLASNILDAYSCSLEDVMNYAFFEENNTVDFINRFIRNAINRLNGNLIISTVFDYYQQSNDIKVKTFYAFSKEDIIGIKNGIPQNQNQQHQFQIFNLIHYYLKPDIYDYDPEFVISKLPTTLKNFAEMFKKEQTILIKALWLRGD